MAAVLLDGELPAQPLGRDGAGDDGRQGQAASQTRLGYTLKLFLHSPNVNNIDLGLTL